MRRIAEGIGRCGAPFLIVFYCVEAMADTKDSASTVKGDRKILQFARTALDGHKKAPDWPGLWRVEWVPSMSILWVVLLLPRWPRECGLPF